MPAYQKGQTVKLSVAFTDANGVPANPTTVTCKVEEPDKTETSYSAVSTPAITNPTTGTYQLIIAPDQSGNHTVRWEGVTGDSRAVDEEQFHVLLSAF